MRPGSSSVAPPPPPPPALPLSPPPPPSTSSSPATSPSTTDPPSALPPPSPSASSSPPATAAAAPGASFTVANRASPGATANRASTARGGGTAGAPSSLAPAAAATSAGAAGGRGRLWLFLGMTARARDSVRPHHVGHEAPRRRGRGRRGRGLALLAGGAHEGRVGAPREGARAHQRRCCGSCVAPSPCSGCGAAYGCPSGSSARGRLRHVVRMPARGWCVLLRCVDCSLRPCVFARVAYLKRRRRVSRLSCHGPCCGRAGCPFRVMAGMTCVPGLQCAGRAARASRR